MCELVYKIFNCYNGFGFVELTKMREEELAAEIEQLIDKSEFEQF